MEPLGNIPQKLASIMKPPGSDRKPLNNLGPSTSSLLNPATLGPKKPRTPKPLHPEPNP